MHLRKPPVMATSGVLCGEERSLYSAGSSWLAGSTRMRFDECRYGQVPCGGFFNLVNCNFATCAKPLRKSGRHYEHWMAAAAVLMRSLFAAAGRKDKVREICAPTAGGRSTAYPRSRWASCTN